MTHQALLGDTADKLHPDAVARITQALDTYLAAKSQKEDTLLDVVLPAFAAAGHERARAFNLLDAAEVERKARRKAELELKAQERAAKKAAKGGPGSKASGAKKATSSDENKVNEDIKTLAIANDDGPSADVEGRITAISQQSRFHSEAIVTASKEIDLEGVHLAVGNVELLDDAHLRLKEGVKYGLVGRNGTGKSTLLRAMAENLIPGLSPSIRIILVSQIDAVQRQDSSTSSPEIPETALQFVFNSDRERKKASEDLSNLSRVLESDNASAADIHAAVSTIYLARKKAELEDAQRIASKRSGARGAEARKRLLEAEATMSAEQARARATEGETLYTSTDATHIIAELAASLELMEAATAESRARAVLLGLGFAPRQLEQPVSTFSGGWRSRLALASALLIGSHSAVVLLLDEPTNYLDIAGVIWLEGFINSLQCTVVTVSHDRAFCDATTEELIVLGKKKLKYFEGNLSAYEVQEQKTFRKTLKMAAAQEKKKAHIQKSIEEGMS